MPGIVPLGNQLPTPALGTMLESCAPTYQALLASAPAGTCLSMEKFLLLTARLSGSGGSVSVEKVMRLGLCTI